MKTDWKTFNRNLVGGKRRHKGWTKLKECKNMKERLQYETFALNAYLKRIINFNKHSL